MDVEDRTLVCKDCNREFLFSASEQLFYQQKGFENTPVRCKPCRDTRKQSLAGHGHRSLGPSGPRDAGTRTLYPATCSACGSATQLPFPPTAGRPVYCTACFRSRSFGSAGA